jgi:D-amino-acid oxidase
MKENIGVIGAGITGLATAYVLSAEYNVTIVARDLPGDLGLNWASPWYEPSRKQSYNDVIIADTLLRAGAVFHPQRTTDKLQQEMQRKSFRFYWELAHKDPSSGVKIYPMTEYLDDRSNDSNIWYKDLMPDYRVLPSSELPDGTTLGLKYTALAINPLLFLPWIKLKLEAKGVHFIRSEVKSINEVRSLAKARLIVNASGVGAKELAKDDNVKSIRGQTMFVKTDFEELLMIEGSKYTYVIPRAGSGGVIMGGIKSDRLDAEIDPALKNDILKRVNSATNGRFKNIDVNSNMVTDIVGFRPGREGGLRVEREGEIVHAYGLAGAGYIFSFGVADRVRELISRNNPKSKL